MQTGNRKFWLGILSLLGYIAILIARPSFDPFALGGGIATVLAPIMFANAAEHKWSAKKGEENGRAQAL